jgi:hypothetical protein
MQSKCHAEKQNRRKRISQRKPTLLLQARTRGISQGLQTKEVKTPWPQVNVQT